MAYKRNNMNIKHLFLVDIEKKKKERLTLQNIRLFTSFVLGMSNDTLNGLFDLKIREYMNNKLRMDSQFDWFDLLWTGLDWIKF